MALSLCLLVNCQDEIEPVVKVDENAITSDDLIAELIVAVATKDGSQDNLIDESSCTTVKFPVRGIYDDAELLFNSFEEVERLGAGALEIDWIYPIEVFLSDHSEVVLASEDDLEIIRAACIEGGGDADNECIDFGYPYTIQIFNTRTEKVYSREVKADNEAYQLFSSTELVITIDYPLTLMTADDTFQVVSNEELINALIASENTCSEDDIVEFEDIFIEEFRDLFASGTWSITYYEENGLESTSIFDGYVILFSNDLTLMSQGPETIDGEWDIELNDTGQSVSMAFDTDTEPLILLNETWKISGYNETEINLEVEDSEEVIKKLKFQSS